MHIGVNIMQEDCKEHINRKTKPKPGHCKLKSWLCTVSTGNIIQNEWQSVKHWAVFISYERVDIRAFNGSSTIQRRFESQLPKMAGQK